VTLYVNGLGHFHPEVEITNAFLEGLDIGTTESWIFERVGIRSRRTTLPLDYIRDTRNSDPRAGVEAALYDTTELGRRAAERALESAGIDRSAVGMVIVGNCGTDFATPTEAALVADRLGVTAPCIDVGSACTSFAAQMHLLSMMRPEALPDYVLVVVTDAMTRWVDYSDRGTAVLFGDAAAAAIVSPRHPGRARILSTELRSDPSGSAKVTIPRMGHFAQEGRAVQMFAIKKTLEQVQRIQAEHEGSGRVAHFVGHQANLRVLESVCERAKIAPEHHHSNVEWFGNTGSPSCASVLSRHWDKWGAGDDVIVAVVGAGLTWGSFLLRFGDES
jgi:3-oxoacyl-[acyl-carrier-protein] synthase-3